MAGSGGDTTNPSSAFFERWVRRSGVVVTDTVRRGAFSGICGDVSDENAAAAEEKDEDNNNNCGAAGGNAILMHESSFLSDVVHLSRSIAALFASSGSDG